MFADLTRWVDSLFGRAQEDRYQVQRWIMLDVETTGLDPRADQLLAIAAVALRFTPSTGLLEVSVGDSFEVVLRQDKPSAKDNILIHHIGVQAQSEGCAPELALEQLNVRLDIRLRQMLLQRQSFCCACGPPHVRRPSLGHNYVNSPAKRRGCLNNAQARAGI